MPPSVDPAILRALSLNASTAKLCTHGGSGFASTMRLKSDDNSYFIKTSSSKDAATMFEGEHASLNAINSAVPSLAPRSFAWGRLEEQNGFFLVTEFLDMSNARSSLSSSNRGMSLTAKLAKLHTVPVPSEFQGKGFGFPVPTCCGNTVQENGWKSTWAEFFGENRLMTILKSAEMNNGKDAKLRQLVEDVVAKVVPRLLGEGQLGGKEGIKPVVCHGDLWSGNKGRGTFSGRNNDSAAEDVVFDPSAVYGHSEYDHGIMNMFGGFSASFWKEYHSLCPKTEPADEYEDRVRLYEAYHHLNHYSMFGGGYKSGALDILQRLLKKYG